MHHAGGGDRPDPDAPALARRGGATRICDARREHPDWGPGKLLDWLGPRHPDVSWPAVSTAGDLLVRRGLVTKRRRRRPHQHPGVVPPVTSAPNDLWTADFKGQFPTRDGVAIRTDNGGPFATSAIHGLSRLNVW